MDGVFRLVLKGRGVRFRDRDLTKAVASRTRRDHLSSPYKLRLPCLMSLVADVPLVIVIVHLGALTALVVLSVRAGVERFARLCQLRAPKREPEGRDHHL